jgi:iron complex transport system substrate-binding protein
MPANLMPAQAAYPSPLADMTLQRHSLFHGAAVFIKDTSGRIHLALTRAFLVRWMVALAIGDLPFAGLRVGLLMIASLALCGAAKLQAMPRDDLTGSASRIEVKDETGRTVQIPQPVRRIVSLAPSVTETLFALGVGDRLVGDTDFCDYPPEAKRKTHIGGPVNPNIEAIAALHPDLVVATREINRPDSVHSLERLGIAVYATDPQTVVQVLTSTERLGQLLGAGDAGRLLVANLRQRLGEVGRRLAGLPAKNVLMVVWLDPVISVGRNTFLDDALRRAGARSVIDSPQSWPTIDLEQVVHLQPEYLIISNDNGKQVQRELAELHERPGWRRLGAVRNRRFIVLSEAISHPSPRLVDGIEQLARALYPSAFAADAAFVGDPRWNRRTFASARVSQPSFSFTQTGGRP